MDFKVSPEGCLLFIMDENNQTIYIIDTEDETLHILTKKTDENR